MTNNEFDELLKRFDEKLEAEFVKHINIVFGKIDQIMEEIELYRQDLIVRRTQIGRIKQHVGLEV